MRVRAAGLNGGDMMQLRGLYPAPPGYPQDIPGMELAGDVVELGAPGTERFAVGDRVMAIVGGGAQAELMTVHERLLMPVPESLDWAAAGRFARGFYHGARRDLHSGAVAPRRAAARPRRRRRRGHGRDPARPVLQVRG